MVRILSLNPDQSWLLVPTGSYLGPYGYIAVGPVDDFDAYKNLNLDEFAQGGVFDDAGNKSVYSRKVDGSFVLPPTVGSTKPSTLECWPASSFTGSVTKYSTYEGWTPIIAFVPIASDSETAWVFQDSRRYWEYPWHAPKYECEMELTCKIKCKVMGSTLRLSSLITSNTWRVDGKSSVTRYITSFTGDVTIDRYTRLNSYKYSYWRNASMRSITKYGDGRKSESVREITGSIRCCMSNIACTSIATSCISPTVWSRFVGPNLDFMLPSNEWEQLGYDAINSADYTDMNLVALAGDISELPNFVKTLVEDGIKLAKDSAKMLKDRDRAKLADYANEASGFYLENIYGLNLTIPDTQSFFSIFNRAIKEAGASASFVKKLRSRTQYDVNVHGFQLPCTMSYQARVRLRGNNIQDRLASCMNELYKWDAFGWDNLWDLVPFSFVIDWFVKIGDLLADVDAWSKSRYYDLLSVVKSVKFDAVPLPAANFVACRDINGELVKLDGFCSLTWYRRWGEFEFPPFPTADNLQFGDPSKLWGHWKEATALIVQKLT